MSYPLITLYTPGTRPELAQKAKKYNIDTVIVDLEDTVPTNLKNETRGIISSLIPSLPYRPIVRVNNEPHLLEDDLRAVVTPQTLGIFFPKAEKVEELRETDKIISSIEKDLGIETNPSYGNFLLVNFNKITI